MQWLLDADLPYPYFNKTIFSILVFLPSVVLPGILFPGILLPKALCVIGKIFPATWGYRLMTERVYCVENVLPIFECVSALIWVVI